MLCLSLRPGTWVRLTTSSGEEVRLKVERARRRDGKGAARWQLVLDDPGRVLEVDRPPRGAAAARRAGG